MSTTLIHEDKAAMYIGLKPKTLQRRRWAGQPPSYIKVGSRVLYDTIDLDAFLASGKVIR